MFGLTNAALSWILAGAIALAAFGGWKLRDNLCDAAEAKANLAAEILKREKAELELAGYKAAAKAATEAVDALKLLKEHQDEELQKLAAELAKQPNACRATADTVRRLLAIP